MKSNRYTNMLIPSYTTPSLVRLHGVERSERISTYSEIAALVNQARMEMASVQMPAKPNSAVGSLFAKADQLNRDWLAGVPLNDLEMLMHVDEAKHIAEVILKAIRMPAARESIRRITKSDMRLSTKQCSQGKDALWELSLMSFLQERGVKVIFKDPPDLEVTLSDLLGVYGIACKKVYSEDSVSSQFSKGLRQLEPYSGAGLVAFNLDELIPKSSLLKASTRLKASDQIQRLNFDFIKRHQLRFQEGVLAGRCDGVWVSSSIHADVVGLSPRFNRITENTLWTVSKAGHATAIRLDALAQTIDAPSD